MKDAIAVLCAGGPAPGINTVISSVTKIFINNGYNVLGINGGYKSLFADEPAFEYLDFEYADQIYSRGGSALKMSRYKPKDEEFKVDFFKKNNVKLLVTIGGDDTASTANRLTKFLAKQKLEVKNIHVPKTIDNDLPLPEGTPTFGYHSAKEEGVRLCTTIYEDARTSGNWFVVSAMGREAGHLAFGIGTACHYPMIVIPELGNVSKSHIFNMLTQQHLKNLRINVKSRPEEIGYELRCCRPIACDLSYATRLGLGVYSLFSRGETGCMTTIDRGGNISPLYLKDVEDENGKVKPRLVNIDSEQVQVIFRNNLHYITQEDYRSARKYVKNPEEYDFLKIL